MKLFFVLFCFSNFLASAQTDSIVSKTITVANSLSVSDLEDLIDGFPKNSFAITDFHFTTTLKGKIISKGTMENYLGLHGKEQYPFKRFNMDHSDPTNIDETDPVPGMIVRIDKIHVIRKPGAIGEIEVPAILEFILTE